MHVFESALSSKFQVTLPKKLRELLGIRENNQVMFVVEENEARIIALTNPLQQLISLADGQKITNLRKDVKKARKEW